MDLWIIQDGEKIGPIHDFEIRSKIERGELPPDTPAWHEGLTAWQPLIEIALFQREFDPPVDHRDSPYAPPVQSPDRSSPSPLPEPFLWWPFMAPMLRRFFARWLDLSLFSGIWWIAMWAAGRDIEAAIYNPWGILLHYVPWFVLESFLLHRFGTTPGKWLLGLKVINQDGSLLTLAQATRRSARVLCIGLGFGFGVLTLICQGIACYTVKRLGRPVWDHAGGHLVTATPLNPLSLVVFVFLLFGSLQLQMIVVSPYVLETAVKNFPSFKERLEKNPPWHLPKNS